MSQNAVPQVTQPNYHRTARLVAGTTVEAGYLLKRSGNAPGGVAITSAPGDRVAGVSTEQLVNGGPARSMQVDGCARVVAGGAFSRGAKLTSDAQGRVVLSSAGTDFVCGEAESESTGAGDWAAVELSL